MNRADATLEVESLEIELLLAGIVKRYGYDFREYAPASLRRRVLKAMHAERVDTISALQERILRDRTCMERFVTVMSVHLTAMFRDPSFYRALRDEVVPLLRTYPFLRVWVAGCSTGEEAYSLAILLEEEGLYDRCRIYATDLSDALLQRARRGVFPLNRMRENTNNYLRAGGRREFSSYYTADSKNALFRGELRRNLVFSQHNLVSDRAFNEFQLVSCRNVMIYFDNSLRNRVLKLLHGSLCRFGVLGLGHRETIDFSAVHDLFTPLERGVHLYRKIR